MKLKKSLLLAILVAVILALVFFLSSKKEEGTVDVGKVITPDEGPYTSPVTKAVPKNDEMTAIPLESNSKAAVEEFRKLSIPDTLEDSFLDAVAFKEVFNSDGFYGITISKVDGGFLELEDFALSVGDIITHIEQDEILRFQQFEKTLNDWIKTDTIIFTVSRNNSDYEIEVALE